ncbi:MAG: CPBP family intramembrane glutamic endopeptidase [Halobacteriota archaeon]
MVSPRTIDRLRAVVVALSIGVVGIVAGTTLAIGAALALSVVGVALTPISIIVLSLVLVQGVAFGGTALVYLLLRETLADSSRRDRPEFVGARVPTGRDLVVVVVGYVMAFAAAILGAMLVTVTGVEAGTNRVAEFGFENPEVLLLLIPASFLLIGPGEELLFRGVVQGRIREAFGPVFTIALASFIFAAIHFTALTGGADARLVSIGILFFPSLVFGSAYELTRNVVVPALIHGAYNATLFTLLYVFIRLAPELPQSGFLRLFSFG